ncbi:MAG: hypothetical protein Kow0059_11910 [Candidatus Sumerlaeia bacterium]
MSNDARDAHRRRRLLRLLGGGGAVVWLALALAFAARTGFVTDEGHHLAAGLAMLHAADFRMNPEHPPLVKALAALPLMLIAPPDFHPSSAGMAHVLDFAWRRSDPWTYLHAVVLMADDVPWQMRLWLARLAPILIGWLGGALAFVWGRELTRRPEGGLLAAGFLIFYPEYLGHACLVTFDVPLLVAGAAVGWAAWQWWRRPDRRRGMAFALTGAVAAQVKLPATFFLVLTLAVLLCLTLAGTGGRVRLRSVIALGAATAAAWWLGAWAAAGFRFSLVNPAEPVEGGIRFGPPVSGENLGLLLRACNAVWERRLLPEATISQFIHLSSFERRVYYLMGETSTTGWYHYFPVTFALKTPLPLIAALPILAGRGLRLWRGRRARVRLWRIQRAAVLGGPFLLLGLLVAASRINIGHRHILFIYFPLCVGLGAELTRWLQGFGRRRGRLWRRAGAGILAAGQLASLVLAWPNLTTYFNLIGGSPWRASRWVGDSNTDWGQDDVWIAPRLGQLGYRAMNLSLYVAAYAPEVLGMSDYRWINPYKRPPFTHQHWDAPDPDLPTVVSVNEVRSLRQAFPDRYGRDPDLVWNSHVVYLPPPGGK